MSCQRLALKAVVPQLAPKRHLDQADGTVTLATAAGRLAAPVVAVALLALTGLPGVATLTVVACALAVAVTGAVGVPNTSARPVGSVTAELAAGIRVFSRDARMRHLLVFRTALSGLVGPLVLMLPPLVLAVGTVSDLGWILLGGALAGAGGGVGMAVWGGPARRRVRLALLCTLGLAVSAAVIGLGDGPAAVGAGVVGMALTLTVLGATHAAIVEVKVPLRFQSPVSALATALSWAAAIGLAGAAAVVGNGLGSSPGLTYVLSAAALALLAATAVATGLPRVLDDGPDATPDDVIGLQALGRIPTLTTGRGAAGPEQELHGDIAGR